MDDWPPRGLPLSTFVKDARVLDGGAFAARYGKAFLLRHTVSMPVVTGPIRTRTPDGSERASDTTGEVTIVVHPVKRRPTSEHPFIGVGRLDGNDIAIVDDTISKFHAYFKETAAGFAVQDGRSRNGTQVEGKPVAPRGEGPPTPVHPGEMLRFGSVPVTFLDAKALIELAKRL